MKISPGGFHGYVVYDDTGTPVVWIDKARAFHGYIVHVRSRGVPVWRVELLDALAFATECVEQCETVS
jgi:hypothetical protein